MTTKLYIEDIFECSPEELYKLMADNALDDELMAELNITKETLSEEADGDKTSLKLRLTMPDEIPALFRKFIGDKLSYVETRVWDPSTVSNTWVIEPEVSVKNIDVKGTVTIKAHEKGCLRITQGTLDVGIPLVGKKVEATLLENIESTFKKNADFYRKKIAS